MRHRRSKGDPAEPGWVFLHITDGDATTTVQRHHVSFLKTLGLHVTQAHGFAQALERVTRGDEFLAHVALVAYLD